MNKYEYFLYHNLVQNPEFAGMNPRRLVQEIFWQKRFDFVRSDKTYTQKKWKLKNYYGGKSNVHELESCSVKF